VSGGGRPEAICDIAAAGARASWVGDTILFGATVKLKCLTDNEIEEFTLVGEGENDPFSNRILTTSPMGLAVTVTYSGSPTPPKNAGSYVVVATITDPNYVGSNSETLVINPTTPNISVSPYSVSYDNQPHGATGFSAGALGEALAGLDLSTTVHTTAGSYRDNWIFTDTTGNYTGSTGTITDVIAKVSPVITVSPYTVAYDATVHTATGSAVGVAGELLAGLELSGTTHANAGTYTDAWTFADSTGNYTNASGLVSDSIAKASATIALAPSAVMVRVPPLMAGGAKSDLTATRSSTGMTRCIPLSSVGLGSNELQPLSATASATPPHSPLCPIMLVRMFSPQALLRAYHLI